MLVATDADGDTLTYTVTSQPADGELSGTAPELTYTPDAGWTGTDTFTFTAYDGSANSDEATVTITVAVPVITGGGGSSGGGGCECTIAPGNTRAGLFLLLTVVGLVAIRSRLLYRSNN